MTTKLSAKPKINVNILPSQSRQRKVPLRVRLAVERRDRRVTYAPSRRATASAPRSRQSKLITAMGAPVATASLSSKTFFNTTMRGDDIIVHCCDRIPEGVAMDLATFTIPNINYPGSVLLKIPLNPSSMGERLRRLSSNYELYHFPSAQVHYAPARGTQTAGSLLGFFDQDPVDEFDAGARSLAEAAAHPLAHSVKIWEDGLWVMPPRPSGRFYVDRAANTSADLRLQDQGNFRIMLDVPPDESILTTGSNFVLGSIYVEYVCVLSKPTIQSNFVGTCDLFTASAQTAVTLSSTTDNLLTSFNTAEVSFVPDPRSNGGCSYLPEVLNGSHPAFSIPEGVWLVHLRFRYNSIPTTSDIGVIHRAAIEVDGKADAKYLDDGVLSTAIIGTSAPSTESTADPQIAVNINTTAAVSVIRNFNDAFMVTVPASQFRYYAPSILLGSGDSISIFDLSVTMATVWPYGDQEDLINPQSISLAKRLLAVEGKLVMAPQESKLEDKRPVITVIENGKPDVCSFEPPTPSSVTGSNPLPPTVHNPVSVATRRRR